MKKINKLFISHKGVLIFSFLKYIEIILTSLTTFFLAKRIGPQQLGEAVPILLYITYANYLTLGLNQVVTKNFSRIVDEKKVDFITINFQYILIISIINIILAYFFIGNDYFIFAACISIFTIARGFFSSYFRSVNRIRVLNINNICFSFVLFISIFFFTNNLKDYLYIWSFLLFIATIFYLFFDLFFFSELFKNLLRFPHFEEVKFNFYEGVKLALSGFLVTIFLTFDRFVINKIDIPLQIKGSFQLADYVGMAIYMVITTIIFYFYPQWIRKIREDEAFSRTYLRKCTKFIFLLPFLLLIIYVLGLVLIPYLFSEYPNLLAIVLGVAFAKLGVISLSFSSLYFIGKDREREYIKWLLLPLLILLGFGTFVILNNWNGYLIIPFVNGGVMFTTCLFIFWNLIREQKKNKL